MSEPTTMTEENKKTIIAFIAGLLIGGLLVYIFANPAETKTTNTADKDEATPRVEVNEVSNNADEDADTVPAIETPDKKPVVVSGEGSVEVADQAAGMVVNIDSAEFPADAGWIGIRDYQNGQLTGLLGVARWNDSEGLSPKAVPLLRATVAGQTYAAVFYRDNGDRQFNLANDAQFDGILSSFEAE